MIQIKPDLSNFENITSRFFENNIRVGELGFVITNKDYNKTLLASICIHALSNPNIFDENQKCNIRNIINTISYE